MPTMFDNDNKNDTTLTDTKSTKLDVERSKREDGINTLRCGNCEKEFDIFLDPNHAYRCGALNSMET